MMTKPLSWSILLFSAFVLALLATAICRAVAVRRNLLDIPNQRSSHHRATPRGGGLGFVAAFSMLIPIATAQDFIKLSLQDLTLCLSAIAIGFIGFADDIRPIKARWRFCIQLLASIALLTVIFTTGSPMKGLSTLATALTGSALLVCLLWMTNLYNFMDGIDGLAASHTTAVCFVIAGIAHIAHWPGDYGAILLLLGTCSMGFLVLNWPPAKIFMGDTGSGFLGFVLGGVAISMAIATPNATWVWLIMLAVFITDSSITLITRIIDGKKFYLAHRSHTYQIVTRKLQATFTRRGLPTEIARARAHRIYDFSILGIIALWLSPIALLCAKQILPGIVTTFIAYTPITITCLFMGAGRDPDPVV